MSDWTANALMWWSGEKVSDHGREPLNESVERIGTDKRMANGTMRRHFVANKRTWTTSWQNLPSTNAVTTGYKTVDGGMAGEDIEEFYNTTPGAFIMILRRGSAIDLPVPSYTDLPFSDENFYIARVMITEFSKEVVKRGAVDFWNVNITMEEV